MAPHLRATLRHLQAYVWSAALRQPCFPSNKQSLCLPIIPCVVCVECNGGWVWKHTHSSGGCCLCPSTHPCILRCASLMSTILWPCLQMHNALPWACVGFVVVLFITPPTWVHPRHNPTQPNTKCCTCFYHCAYIGTIAHHIAHHKDRHNGNIHHVATHARAQTFSRYCSRLILHRCIPLVPAPQTSCLKSRACESRWDCS